MAVWFWRLAVLGMLAIQAFSSFGINDHVSKATYDIGVLKLHIENVSRDTSLMLQEIH